MICRIAIMKKTPLTEVHRALGAKMTNFAGYTMPLQYTSVSEEHDFVRNRAGLFDVSHMGEFIVKGKDALDLVQYVTSNDASVLDPGEAQYSCMPNEDGGIVDDLLVYRLGEDQCEEGERAFMLVVNAGNIEKGLTWINKNNSFDSRVIDISHQCGLLALQGPLATDILSQHTNLKIDKIKYYTFEKGEVAGCQNIIVSATGYTGSGGYELYGNNDEILKIWNALLNKSDEKTLKPAGLGARDTLRLEMGFCLYGNDIDDHTSPLEAGLSWITKLQKNDFVGIDWLKTQKIEGIKRKLVGFTTEDRRVPRKGYKIEDEDGNEIGIVTSGTFSPSLEVPIGMGYVSKQYAKPGNRINFVAGRKKVGASICKMPFYKK